MRRQRRMMGARRFAYGGRCVAPAPAAGLAAVWRRRRRTRVPARHGCLWARLDHAVSYRRVQVASFGQLEVVVGDTSLGLRVRPPGNTAAGRRLGRSRTRLLIMCRRAFCRAERAGARPSACGLRWRPVPLGLPSHTNIREPEPPSRMAGPLRARARMIH